METPLFTWHWRYSVAGSAGPTTSNPWATLLPLDFNLRIHKLRTTAHVIKTGPPANILPLSQVISIQSTANSPLFESLTQAQRIGLSSNDTPSYGEFLFTPDTPEIELEMPFSVLAFNAGYSISSTVFDAGGYQFLGTDTVVANLYVTFERITG